MIKTKENTIYLIISHSRTKMEFKNCEMNMQNVLHQIILATNYFYAVSVRCRAFQHIIGENPVFISDSP